MEDVGEAEPEPEGDEEELENEEEEEDDGGDGDEDDGEADADESNDKSGAATAAGKASTSDAASGGKATRGGDSGDGGANESGVDIIKPEPEDDPSSTLDGPTAVRSPSAPVPSSTLFRPVIRQEYFSARTYDIVPTMAAPQSTSVNCISATPDMRFWMTGGSDGYVRKYDGAGTINGRQLLTVAQRHPFVDSVVKGGILMSYWENEEPPVTGSASGSGGRLGSTAGLTGVSSVIAAGVGAEEHVLSPVYSLAVHSQALWLLSGLESGGINLQSVRHDEGKRITCLRGEEGSGSGRGHRNAVSVLNLAPDEKSVLSGSWDKMVLDWDLNNGQVIRRFEGSGGQISAIELRPASGAPVPAEASVEEKSETMQTDGHKRTANGVFVNGLHGTGSGADGVGPGDDNTGLGDAVGSPGQDSLFGSPAGSLFGDNDGGGGGGGGFGADDDDMFSSAIEMTLRDDDSGQPDHSRDFTMTDPDNPAPGLESGLGGSQAPAAGAEPTDGSGAVNGHAASQDTEMVNGDAAHDSTDVTQSGNAAGTETQPSEEQQTQASGAEPTSSQPAVASPPAIVFGAAAVPANHDPTQVSDHTFMSASMDGAIRIWDRRVPNAVARIGNRPGIPPWCMGTCWSPDGNWIYAGRRNGTVEEFNIHRARSGWAPERVLKFPAGSGPVSCVRPMVNGRHLMW
jgi:transcriptional activator SPT8